jgi:hypothetical protein
MVVIEVMLTALLVVAAVAGVVAWLTRPMWRAVARRCRMEAQEERLLAEARRELQGWLKVPDAAVQVVPDRAQLKAAAEPVLRAVLERYPLDDRVQEVARMYQQVTGKTLLPGYALGELPEEPTAPPRPLTDEEKRHAVAAAREVAGWSGTTAAPEQEQENRA